MCCWQRTSALPPWALSQQARKLSAEPSCREKTFVNDVQAMTCTLPDPSVCILNATFSRTFNSACFESDNVEFQILWFCFSQLLQSHLQHHPPRLPFPISPLICQPSALMGELWWGLNLLSCCLCGLCVLRYESWPLKANASQAASECTWQLLSGLLIHRWRGKCQENAKSPF